MLSCRSHLPASVLLKLIRKDRAAPVGPAGAIALPGDPRPSEDRAVKPAPARGLLGLSLALAALLANAAVTFGSLHGLVEAQREVTRSHETLVELAQLFATVEGAEASQQRFLLSGDRAQLSAFEGARSVVATQLKRLGHLFEGDVPQTARLGDLAQAVQRDLERLSEGARMGREGRREEALARSGEAAPVPGEASVRGLVAALEEAERRSLSAAEAEAVRRRFAAFSSGLASALLGLGLIAIAALLLRGDLAVRAEAASALEAANSSLREADRRKDEFLAALAHELRNPLAAMRSALELVEAAEARPAPEAPALRSRGRAVLSRQLSHLTRLVDDLLDLSRVSSSRLALRREAVTLAGVVDAAVETARPAIEERGHALAVARGDRDVVVSGDPVRLVQVVGNLLGNAAKFTPAGGRIEVSVAADDAEAVVRVTDDGIGLAAGDLQRVFDLFEQGPAHPRAEGGLGVGLALSRRIAALHGGTLTATSPGPGKGSTFSLHLPRVPAPPRPAPAPPAPRAGGPPRRVLLVDDNADARSALSELLSLSGHEVREAADGESAIEAALGERPDAVLLDLGLPGMDGCEVARRLRAEPGLEGLLLVALSGWAGPEDRLRTAEAGFDHHLAKPVPLARLQEVLAAPRPTERPRP